MTLPFKLWVEKKKKKPSGFSSEAVSWLHVAVWSRGWSFCDTGNQSLIRPRANFPGILPPFCSWELKARKKAGGQERGRQPPSRGTRPAESREPDPILARLDPTEATAYDLVLPHRVPSCTPAISGGAENSSTG